MYFERMGYYNGKNDTKKKKKERAFQIMDNNSDGAALTLYSLSLYQLPLSFPSLTIIPHPCLCWRWSTAGCEATVSS